MTSNDTQHWLADSIGWGIEEERSKFRRQEVDWNIWKTKIIDAAKSPAEHTHNFHTAMSLCLVVLRASMVVLVVRHLGTGSFLLLVVMPFLLGERSYY